MLIGGLLKFSLIDYPGKVAAVIFTQGCNYRCPFCHNPELVLPGSFDPPIQVDDVMAFLTQRRGQLQGVVITGGEPTIHPRFSEICHYLKSHHKGRMHLVLGTNLIPFAQERGRFADLKRTVFDTFGAMGVFGEGLGGGVDIVALNVPQNAEFRRIKTVLQQGEADGRWAYEEGSITRAWSSA